MQSTNLLQSRAESAAEMLERILVGCKLFISEGRNPENLQLIEQAAKQYPGVVVVNKFMDEFYNRIRYTLVSHVNMNSRYDPTPLRSAVFAMVTAASESIDLEMHSGSHPRLGVVDTIYFHPLAQASLDQAAKIARSIAIDIGYKLQLPTYLCEAADEGGRTLDSVRRELGYFIPNSEGKQWTGGLATDMLPLKPDVGPLHPSPAKGVVVIAATRWFDTYNVPVRNTDIEAVRGIAKKVSERGGGLKAVQSIGLYHGEDCFEVACNLLDQSVTGAERVQEEVRRLASEEGFQVGEGYFTDFLQEEIIDKYLDSIPCDLGEA